MRTKTLFTIILLNFSQIIPQTIDWNILHPSDIGTFKHIEVRSDGSIYLLTDLGLYKSRNKGQSWKKISDQRTKSFALSTGINRIISGYDESANHYLNISEEDNDTLKLINKHFLGSQNKWGDLLLNDLTVNTYFILEDKSYVVVDYWDYQKYGRYYSHILFNNNQDTTWQKINYPEYHISSFYVKDRDTIIVGNNHATSNNSTFGWNTTISYTFDGGASWSYYPGLIWNDWTSNATLSSVLITSKKAIIYGIYSEWPENNLAGNGIFRLDDFRNTNFSNDPPTPWNGCLWGTWIVKIKIFYSPTKLYALAPNSLFTSATDGKNWYNITNGQTISNALDFCVDNNGILYIISAHDIFISTHDLTGIVADNSHLPIAFSLSQNYPNPFNPTTTISYSIPEVNLPSREGNGRGVLVTLKVYDVLGREIATLINEQKATGNYEVTFNGASLPSGIYFYRMQTGSFAETKKLVLMK